MIPKIQLVLGIQAPVMSKSDVFMTKFWPLNESPFWFEWWEDNLRCCPIYPHTKDEYETFIIEQGICIDFVSKKTIVSPDIIKIFAGFSLSLFNLDNKIKTSRNSEDIMQILKRNDWLASDEYGEPPCECI